MDPIYTAKDFQEWLAKNRRHFLRDDYTSDEVASLAHYVGFDWPIITAGLAHFSDALSGSDFDRRARFHHDANTRALNARCGNISLLPQWSALGRKLLYDMDFEDAA